MSMEHKAFIFDYAAFELELKSILETDLDRILILGKPIGKEDNYFDPGRMGSYFQSHKPTPTD